MKEREGARLQLASRTCHKWAQKPVFFSLLSCGGRGTESTGCSRNPPLFLEALRFPPRVALFCGTVPGQAEVTPSIPVCLSSNAINSPLSKVCLVSLPQQ